MRNGLRDKTDDELGHVKLRLESILTHRGLTAKQRKCIQAALAALVQFDETGNGSQN